MPEERNSEHQKLVRWFRGLRFRRSFFGLNERDVWNKLEELNRMYEASILAERIRYETLLSERENQKKSVFRFPMFTKMQAERKLTVGVNYSLLTQQM